MAVAGVRQGGVLSYMFIILHISSVNKDYHNLINVILYEVTTKCRSFITTRKADGTTFGRVGQSVCLSVCLCVCLCVCPVRALTFESLDLETSFLVRRYIFRISRPSSYVKVIGTLVSPRFMDKKSNGNRHQRA